jgi:predicted RNA binding protein YcfA (HicA-like mRNA interferase family)
VQLVIPDVSGQEFADALRKAGFDTQTWAGTHLRMVSGSRVVVVPMAPQLTADVLRHLLLAAGLSASRFLELLLAE